MRLLIRQIGHRYKIFKEGEDTPTYIGQWISGLRSVLQTTIQNGNNETLLTVNIDNRKLFYWGWNTVYNITLNSLSKTYKLTCVKYFRQHWRLETETDIYDYYAHKGHKKSIFKNEIQIAAIDKNYLNKFENDTIFIDYNLGENELLLLGLVLAFDMGNDNDGSTISIDFGNIVGSFAKTNNEAWRPEKNGL